MQNEQRGTDPASFVCMSRKFSRRALLVSSGGAALALPFLASWRADSGYGVLSSSRAAAASAAPKRVAFWLGWWGTMPEWWAPIATNADGTQFELNKIMEPLAPLKDKLSVISGMNQISLFKQIGRAGSHDDGAISVSTGGTLLRTTDPQGWGSPWVRDPHFVNLLASKVAPNTRFEATYCGEGSDHNHGSWRGASGNPLTPLWTPESTFDTFFRDFQGDGEERRKVMAGRSSVLDALLPAYERMNARLGASDKRTLDEHLTALRDLERRTHAVSSCSVPQRPEGENPWRQADAYELWGEIMARAFACNLTHFQSFSFSGKMLPVRGVQSPNFDAIRPVNTGGDIHAYGHAGWREPENNQVWGEIQIFRMKTFASFCKRLNEMVDTDGRTILDNTVAIYTSEITTGLHDIFPLQEWGYGNTNSQGGMAVAPIHPRGMPLLYVGGLGNTLKTGMHFEFDKGGADRFGEKLGKYSNSEFYLTIGRALGLTAEQLPTVGMPEVCEGEILDIRV